MLTSQVSVRNVHILTPLSRLFRPRKRKQVSPATRRPHTHHVNPFSAIGPVVYGTIIAFHSADLSVGAFNPRNVVSASSSGGRSTLLHAALAAGDDQACWSE